MPVIGIIAEYNPFHNGHKYQLHAIREKYPDAEIIVAMSGSITQRGETAILNKWDRAGAAVANGADLVLELPAVYAMRSAQAFARGGIRLFNALNIVDNLAFGTEYPDDSRLYEAAYFLEGNTAQKLIHEKIQTGKSYAAAITEILQENLQLEENILREPNTILALEYIRSLIHTGSTIKPLAILRQGASHHQQEIDNNIASGSSIRQELLQMSPDFSKVKNATVVEIYQHLQKDFCQHDKLFLPLLYRLNNMQIKEIQNIYDIGEGIENRLLSSLKSAKNFRDIIEHMMTRRYTIARCQRCIMNIMLGITDCDMEYFDALSPQYARVLAFNGNGRRLLKKIKENSPLPIITKTSDFVNSQDILNNNLTTDLQKMLAVDIRAANLQGLCFAHPQLDRDFLTSPIYVK